jgi:hypothetical protein
MNTIVKETFREFQGYDSEELYEIVRFVIEACADMVDEYSQHRLPASGYGQLLRSHLE